MTRKILNTILITLFFASCNSSKPIQKRKNEYTKICFATGGCFGTCPFLAIEIDSSLSYKFYGGKYVDKTGNFYGRITQGFWDTLNIKLEQININQLDTSFINSVDDLTTETILYFGNQRKHILRQSSSLPDSVMTVFYWIMSSYKTINLTKASEREIRFETRVQNEIPPPIKDAIRFIPPEVK